VQIVIFFCPFSWYSSKPCVDSAILNRVAERYRSLSACLLYTDVSPLLYENGQNFVVPINSGTRPSESAVFGPNSAATFMGEQDMVQKKGFYVAPFKLTNLNSRELQNTQDDWLGIQPYFVSYGVYSYPSSTLLSARIMYDDLWEFPLGNSQLFPIGTVTSNTLALEVIENAFVSGWIISENPSHFKAITNVVRKALDMAPRYLGYANKALDLIDCI